MNRIKRFNENNLVDDSLVKDISDRIITFLDQNSIRTWDKFVESEFARNVINKIIDKSVRTDQELKEVKFYMKLHLYNNDQLKSLLNKYTEIEEFEKCQIIHDKITSFEMSSHF